MADTPEQGLATAARLSLADQPAKPLAEAAEQLDLLGLPASKGRDVVETRPGTRRGIPNKATQEWSKWFSNRGYRLPIEILMDVANRRVDELSRALNVSRGDAMNLIIRCASEAAPFMHARLASIELKPGEPGGPSSTLEITGSLVDVIPQHTPAEPPESPTD
jgi:hypothetical protein